MFEDNTFEAKAKASAFKAKASTFRGQGQFCEDPDPGTLTGSMPMFSKLFDKNWYKEYRMH